LRHNAGYRQINRSLVSWSYRLVGVEGNNAVLVQRPAVVDRIAFLVDAVSAESRIDAQKRGAPINAKTAEKKLAGTGWLPTHPAGG